MNEMIRKRNEQLAKTVIKGLQSRNMSGYYAEDKEAALKQALELIPEGSTIAMGGCMSAHEIGLRDMIEAMILTEKLPDIQLIVVSAEDINEVGMDLTPVVQVAVPKVVEMIKQIL